MKNTIITIIVLLVLLVVSLYGYEMIFKKPLIEAPRTNQEEPILPVLDIKEQYVDGVHTFAGTLSVPTPCHTILSDVVPFGEDAYQIQLSIIPPATEVACAQVISEKNYKVSFAGSENAIVTAIINGVEYELNRYPVPEGENIDTYELFIKG